MIASQFQKLAAYNKWANARLYAAALGLSENDYRKPTGVFFGSLHGTLNHLLLTDRLWLKRLTGEGDDVPNRLDEMLFEDRTELARARHREDERIFNVIGRYDDQTFTEPFKYSNTSGKQFEQPLCDVLMHLFNHQAHHRGQAHSCLSILTRQEPPSLDMLVMQRGVAAPDILALL